MAVLAALKHDLLNAPLALPTAIGREGIVVHVGVLPTTNPQRKIHNPPDMLPELSHVNSQCDLLKMVISGVTGTTVKSVIRRFIDNYWLGAVRQRQSANGAQPMEEYANGRMV